MKKLLVCDMHTHTHYSFDSHQSLEGYCEQAIKVGIDVICFTDHIECGQLNTFNEFLFEQRQREIEQVRKLYQGRVTLLNGFEISEPHMHQKELAFLRSLQPDMIIGSVHYPMHYQPENKWVDRRTYETIYNQCVRDMVECGGFDVLGHIDMPRRYHDDYVEDTAYIQKTLKLCAEKGIVPEMNTSSLRNGCDEPMATFQHIAYYASCGGKYVTISSDSHNADTLGYKVKETMQSLTCVTPCYFVGGKLIPIE